MNAKIQKDKGFLTLSGTVKPGAEALISTRGAFHQALLAGHGSNLRRDWVEEESESKRRFGSLTLPDVFIISAGWMRVGQPVEKKTRRHVTTVRC